MVNGVRYRAMLEDYFWPELDGLDIRDLWFQKDGATSHIAGQTIDLLKGKFGNLFNLEKWSSRMATSLM